MIDTLRQRPGVAWGTAISVAIVIILLVRGEKSSLVIGLITGAGYGMVALGLVLIYKSSGVFNFAAGEFGTVALYVLYLLHINDIPYPLAALGGLVAAIVMGLAVERLIIRPLFDAPRVTLLVATAGVFLLAVGVELWFGEARGRNVAPAVPRLDRFKVLGIQISDQRVLLLVVLIGLAILLGLFFSRTNLGLAILGASQEPTATELVGISVKRLSSFTWALAALLGGLAGILSIPVSGPGTVGPGVVTSATLIPAFTAAVIGGMTSLPGAFLGGVIVGVAQTVATSDEIFDKLPFDGNPGTMVVFLLLLLVLAIRPQGLLGKST